MNSADVVIAPGTGKTWLGNLASVMIRPRRTMRAILDQATDRMVLPLLLLAYVSAIVRDITLAGLQQAMRTTSAASATVIIIVLLICVPIASVLIFYGLSWVVAQIGRLLNGQGTAREIRSALAWGLAPFLWALLYRIPASLFQPATAEGRSLELFRLFQRGGTSIAFAIAEVVVMFWWIFVTSATIGEAHRFSTWRGFATLMVILSIPFILALAAALTLHT